MATNRPRPGQLGSDEPFFSDETLICFDSEKRKNGFFVKASIIIRIVHEGEVYYVNRFINVLVPKGDAKDPDE